MTPGRITAFALTAGLTALSATPTSAQQVNVAPGSAAVNDPVWQDPAKPAKQDEQPPPQVGFSRKDDRTYVECVDFFWHEVTYAVYLADHMPNAPPINIKIGDKNTGKPCRAPLPEHLPGPGGTLPDAPNEGLQRRDDVVVQECINNTWHKITFALFEHWNDKGEPDLTTLPIRVQISDEDTEFLCTPIASPQPQPPGTGAGGAPTGTSTLGTSHARSECGDDGFWHVITDEDWIRPDGTHFKKRSDQKTTHACKAGDTIPPDLPGGTLPKEAGERIEDKEIKECINGFYWYRKYPQYRRADGSTWVDTGPGKWLSQTTKNEPCSEKTGGGAGSGSGNVGMSPTPTAGAYVGGELAKNFASVRSTETLAENGAVTNQFDDSGDPLGFGVVAGDNLTVGTVIVGPFVSFGRLHQTVNHTFTPASFLGTTTHWNFLAGAKVGIVTKSGMFVYGLGGVSWLKQDLNINFGRGLTSLSTMTTGFAIGGGAEFRPDALQHTPVPLALFVHFQHTIWKAAALNKPTASPLFNYTFGRSDNTIKFGVLVGLKR